MTTNLTLSELTLTRPSISKYYLITFTSEESEHRYLPDMCIPIVIREETLIYVSLCSMVDGLSYLDSVQWEEGLLINEFPFGKIGTNNRISFYCDRKNHFRKVYNTSLVVRIIEQFRSCFPMCTGFGASS